MVALAPDVTIEDLSRKAQQYPADLLDECETGLLLFAAGFLGINDAIHFAQHDLVAECVDLDQERLQQMAYVYPESWEFTVADAWKFAKTSRTMGRRWDAVSVDPFTGDCGDLVLNDLELWCSVANRLVTVTITRGQRAKAPDGWTAHRFSRVRHVEWLVLQRNA